MKKLLIIITVTFCFVLASCRHYDDPVLPPKLDKVENSISFIINDIRINFSKADPTAYLSNHDSTLNMKIFVNDSIQRILFLSVPFHKTPSIQTFVSNNSSTHSFQLIQYDSTYMNCIQEAFSADSMKAPFARFEIHEIKKFVLDGDSGYLISGGFEYTVVRNCNLIRDTVAIKNAIFKNIFVNDNF